VHRVTLDDQVEEKEDGAPFLSRIPLVPIWCCPLILNIPKPQAKKAREAFLILKGRTLVPDGLNIREETY